MTELRDLVQEWAYQHCPELLDDDALIHDLCGFIVQVIDYSLLSARRQVYREIHDTKSN